MITLLAVVFFIGNLSASASQFNFAVEAVLPDNQVDKKVSYFDLLMTPGQAQTVQVKLSNSTDKDVTVEIGGSSATTNVNGAVEYSPTDIKTDKSLKYNITDFITLPKEVVLKPKTTQALDVQVTMPEEQFTGVIAGGLTFKQKSSETNSSQNDAKGVSIKNEYSFVIALLMRQEPTIVAPNLQLNDIYANQLNYRNVISANLQNPTMGYLNRMNVDAKITGITDKNTSFVIQKDMMQMAPNTNFDFPIPVSKQGILEENQYSEPLKPGKYHLSMIVHGQEDPNGVYTAKDSTGKDIKYAYEWKFEKDFEITGEEAKKLNEKDVTIKKDNSWIYWLIGALILLIILGFLFFILWKRRQKEDEEDEKEQSNNN
jgi:hypothetical protein